MQKIVVLLFVLMSLIPVFYINKWLQNLVTPRKSIVQLVLYFLVVVEIAFIYTYLPVVAIANLFPLTKG